jgi:hypothetical protein
MRKIESKVFGGYVKSLADQRRTFIVEKKRSVKSILIGTKYIILQKNKNQLKNDKVNKTRITSLFAQVAKCVNAYIIKSELTVKKIKQIGTSSYTNRKKYRLMKDDAKFYYVDIAHCYWRIAFLRDYISETLYKNILETEDLKLYRNMALACIVAPKGREYWIRGEKILEIYEDKTLHRIVYDNIRFTAYNLMDIIKKEVDEHCIAYRTDGIMVDSKKGLEMVKKLITEHNFSYTVTECTKIDELTYKYGNAKTKKM